MARKIQRKDGSILSEFVLTEETVGQKLWDLVQQCESQGIDSESALRRHLAKIEGGMPHL